MFHQPIFRRSTGWLLDFGALLGGTADRLGDAAMGELLSYEFVVIASISPSASANDSHHRRRALQVILHGGLSALSERAPDFF